MIEYNKDKYIQMELSEYELQMICCIIGMETWEKDYWYSETNLADLKQMLNEICCNGISKAKK